MGEAFPYGDILVIAAVAAFVILRYRSVIGQKRGHDFSDGAARPPTEKRSEQNRVVNLHKNLENSARAAFKEPAEIAPTEDVFETFDYLEKFSPEITKIKGLDSQFRLSEFIEGAKAAYEMVLTAYNDNDKDTLQTLLDRPAYKEFELALKAQEKQTTKSHTTLVAISESRIEEISLDKNLATIEVRFVTEQVSVERDNDGNQVSGDASRVEDIEDEWVFERDLRSRNPNWLIVST